jgi:riboflavin synthase
MGVVVALQASADGARLSVATMLPGLELGESVSVSGACLTVAVVTVPGFDADLSRETLERTTLGALSSGTRVNIERAVAVGDRLGGHLVSGHVDGKARVRRIQPAGEAKLVDIECPPALSRYVAEKGSVTLDGVSLTVNAISGTVFSIMLIPHTLKVTTLGELREGSELNLEVDMIARYVERLMSREPS